LHLCEVLHDPHAYQDAGTYPFLFSQGAQQAKGPWIKAYSDALGEILHKANLDRIELVLAIGEIMSIPEFRLFFGGTSCSTLFLYHGVSSSGELGDQL
jgi:hypothetical protein